MILISTPYSFERNLGKAYNEIMSLLPSDDDWAVLRDIDTMFLDNKAPFLIREAINLKPEAGLFTCYASRTGRGEQKFKNTISNDSNINNHRQIALRQQKKVFLKLIKKPIAGFLMVLNKKVWKDQGGFIEKDLFSIDLEFSDRLLKANKPIYLIENLYIFHYYRLMEGGVNYKKHLL